MRKIAFDLEGNDNGVAAGIAAVLEFSNKFLDYSFFLVGNKKEINKYTKETERIKIVDAPDKLDISASPRAARTTQNSMAIAINLVKDGKADVVISAGDSGTYLSLTTILLKRIEGVRRPAFMSVFPTVLKDKKLVAMDVGANLETTSEMLVQWAKIGSIFVNKTLKVKSPKVYLINIGTEEKKGLEMTKEANIALKTEKKLNYKGFTEARELLSGDVDVAIVDGYAGNMILKTMEGTMVSILGLLKSKLKSKTKYKLGALISKGAYKDLKDHLNYKTTALAYIVGLNSMAVKVHGGADQESFYWAFVKMADVIEQDIIKEIKKEFK